MSTCEITQARTRIRRETIALTLAALALVITALVTGFIHPDIYPSLGTYGVSIGTDTAYASAELVHGIPAISWEHAS